MKILIWKGPVPLVDRWRWWVKYPVFGGQHLRHEWVTFPSWQAAMAFAESLISAHRQAGRAEG